MSDLEISVHQYFQKLQWLILGTVLFFSGCQSEEPPTEPQPVSSYFPLKVGEKEISVQVVLAEAERHKGLMYRESLPEDSGMLFVFEAPRQLSFWMKNTKIPLDIAYLHPDGLIAEIYPMYPYNTDSVPSISRQLSMALEMDQGWFRENGIVPGDRIDLANVGEMIRARGFRPEAFAVELP
ncbi:MAG: DUF192 domain-containing protein [Verrucomicrobiota bacterium]